jgi:hypothetical protein
MILQQSEKEFSIEREKEEDLSKIHEKMDDLRATIEEARTGCVSSNEPKESSTVTSHRSTVRDKIVDAEIRLKSLHAEMKTLEIFLKYTKNFEFYRNLFFFYSENVMKKFNCYKNRIFPLIKKM